MKNKVFVSDSKKQFQTAFSLEFEKKPDVEEKVLNIHSDLRFQKVQGFGGAFTDSAAVTFSKMSEKSKKKFIELAFDKEKGLGYNFCRTTINSCDFSEKEYTYVKNGDKTLETFDIAHDKENIIPMIKAAQEKSDDLFLFSSPWSPPAFMKDSGNMIQGGKLKKEMYSVWADYFVKFIKEYKKNGVKIDAVTVQNEPMAVQTWESCVYTIEEQILFATDYLYPAFEKAGLDVKIAIWDHNKEHLYEVAKAIKADQKASERIFGIAFHWYSGEHYSELNFAHQTAPNMFLFASEFCMCGCDSNWRFGLKYAYDMSGNFNNFMNASCDWNILLDENGGPYHNRSTPCNAIVHYDTTKDKIMIMPQYYAVKHFSAFVKKGALRLGTSSWTDLIAISAFENPNGDIVAVITSLAEREFECNLRLGDYMAPISVKPKSITTVLLVIYCGCLSSPKKKRATVPGPQCDEIIVPISNNLIFPSNCGILRTISSIVSCPSSRQLA